MKESVNNSNDRESPIHSATFRKSVKAEYLKKELMDKRFFFVFVRILFNLLRIDERDGKITREDPTKENRKTKMITLEESHRKEKSHTYNPPPKTHSNDFCTGRSRHNSQLTGLERERLDAEEE